MYKFEEDKLLEEIKEKSPKRILLQLPEGLKKEAIRLSNLIQKETNTEVIVSGEHLWGACDIALEEAKNLGCDLIIIYGHTQFIKTDFPVIYLEARYEKDITKLLKKVLEKSIALVASVQHIHQIPIAKEFFEKNNINVVIPEAKGNAFYDGQVLGCEYTGLKLINKVESIIVIGNKFHALGASLATNKKVILLDPCSEEVIEIEKEKIMKQRAAAIDKVKQADKIGIIICKKPGQKFGSLDYVKEKLEKMKKEYTIISMDEITNNKLTNLYNIEAFIELGCPRIAIDDTAKFKKPIITAREFSFLTNDITWEDLLEKGFL